jgi:hypothetical protein
MNNPFKKILLLAGDILLMYAALFLTITLRHWQRPSQEEWQAHLFPFNDNFCYLAGCFFYSRFL